MKIPPKPLPAWSSNLNLFLGLLAAILALEMFLIKGNMGLNLADEGFLWYGADRVFHGEVPLRDFQSYAPGRYYWCAAWFRLWRPGILSLRFSESLFQFLALLFGLLAAKRITTNRWQLAGIGLLLTLWMYPDYKYFDCAVPMIAVYTGFRLFENPSPLVFGLAGVFAGLSAFIGFNHGLYQLASLGALVLAACWRQKNFMKKITYWSAGILCGWTPYWGMGLWVKGFWGACAAEIGRIFEQGTNLPLPVPWPWTHNPMPVPWPWTHNPIQGPGFYQLSLFLIGALFIVAPLSYVFWFIKFFPRTRIVSAAGRYLWVCAVIGIPYLHYAFSRADFEHLAVALPPFWLGCLAVAPSFKGARGLTLAFSVLCSFLSVGERSHLTEWLRPSKPWLTECRIGQDRLYLDSDTVRKIEGVRTIVQSLDPGETLLVFPDMPTLYCVFQKKSPVLDIYRVFPASLAQQLELIREIENSHVRWCVIDNNGIDGRDDLKFQNTDPVVWEYLSRHYRLIPSSSFPPSYYLLFYKPSDPRDK